MKNLLLVFFALVLSAASVLYTQSHPLPPPYYGYDPDTLICTQGAIEGSCGGNSAIRCTVTIGWYTGILAYDNKIGSICTVPVFKP